TLDKMNEDIDDDYVSCKSINKVVYLNEDTMDCNYSESASTPKTNKTSNNDVLSSPELFDSDDDNVNIECTKTFRRILSLPPPVKVAPRKATQDELILKSDRYVLARMNKFLRGIPPPPKHTICQSDCSDFLNSIRKNREYFWVDPLKDNKISNNDTIITEPVIQDTTSITHDNRGLFSRLRSSRNLTNAFDACDQSSSSTSTIRTEIMINDRELMSESGGNGGSNSNIVHISSTHNGETTSGHPSIIDSEISISSATTSITSSTEPLLFRDNIKHVTFNVPKEEHLAIFSTLDEAQAKSLPWPAIFNHKAPGIHYNRNIYMEDFENFSTRLCQRYIGNETQSTCTPWFTKQAPGSAKKRALLGKRAIGQSPGKRLSHLARRRRTFSSANLQGMAEKKQIVLNVRKPIVKKGKSPRGKSPRGSAKKRLARRLSMEGPSPHKLKIDTSKRALFQSPPNERASTSNPRQIMPLNNPQRIKRALFPTTQNNEDSTSDELTKKRRNDEDLEQPKLKWAKSYTFDCSYNLENSRDSWTSRYSSGNKLTKSESFSKPIKHELTEINRKKLWWAVSEALRSRAINMAHPRFKQYATQLARTVRKYMPDLENSNVPRKPGSTTDRMLKLAKSHVLLVVDAKCD
ncbi:hypothetical protein PV326_006289, partial [Microctonus aethiopoides]